MTKNRTMRVAVLLLALTLITSCFVGGTFAKYTTYDQAYDGARVAKWGVTATLTGGAFANTYDLQTADTGIQGYAVSSADSAKVVAPGTSGTFTGVALTGTPEVAVKITKTAYVAFDGWMIDDDNNPETTEVFYCPIIVTINGNEYSGLDYQTDAAFEEAIASAITGGNGYYAPNTNLAEIPAMNGDYDWTWSFDNNEDAKDTALGNLADAPTIGLDLTVTVEQVD